MAFKPDKLTRKRGPGSSHFAPQTASDCGKLRSFGLIEENGNLATFRVEDRSGGGAGFGWRGADDPRGSRRHRVVEVRTLRHILLGDFPGCCTLSA